MCNAIMEITWIRACLATHPTTMGVWTITLVANGSAVTAMLIDAPVPAHPMQVAG